MTIIDKIIKGDIAPENTNVLWLNTEDNIIYVFSNGWIKTSTGAAASVYTGTEAERLAIEDPFNGLEFHQVDDNGKVTRYLYDLNAWTVVIDPADYIIRADQDHARAEADHRDADSDHGTATQDHNLAVADHQNAVDDHAQYLVDHESIAHKANVDGYYATMSVGSADNLNGQSADTDTWEERPVGGEGAEVATGLASVQAVGGNGIAWNQLVVNGGFSEVDSNNVPIGWGVFYGGQLTAVNNTASLLNESGGNVGSANVYSGIVGHKYYYSAYTYSPTAGSQVLAVVFGDWANFIYVYASQANQWEHKTGIVTCASVELNQIAISNRVANTTNQFRNIKVIDLTLLGIDNLTTTAEVEAWLAANIGTKPYYPYNAGTLLPAKLQAYNTTGKSANLLNPTTRTARLFAYTWPDHNNMFTIKELPSDLTLTFTPDATGVAETISPDSNGHFSVSGSGNLVVSGSADLSATWLIATWDESMDSYDNFEAWDGKEYAFDTSKVYGKLNGEGDYVQVFPDGMRGAGSARDVLNLASAEAEVNVGSVDFGNLTWSKNNNKFGAFGLNNLGLVNKDAYNQTPNFVITQKYAPISRRDESVNNDMRFSLYLNSSIRIYDAAAYATYTAEQFKTYISGVKMWFELATSMVYTDCVYRDNGIDTPLSELSILVNNWAYEQAVVAQQADAFSTEKAYAIGDYVTYSGTQYRFTAAKTAGAWDSTKVTADASPVSCAAQSTILYGIDAVEAIKTLQDAGIDIDAMHGNLDALLTALQTAGIIGSYTLGETPTNKIFSITVTAPSEPESEP